MNRRGLTPSTAKKALADALRSIGQLAMSYAAERGHYSDFESPLDTPKVILARELASIGTPAAMELRRRVMAGDFDG